MINFKKERGMALFIAMLLLPLLLVLGVLVMNNSFLGLKIIDSRVMQSKSNISLNGGALDILQKSGNAKLFAAATSSAVFTSDRFDGVSGNVTLNGELNCRRRMKASGSNFKCKYLQVNLQHEYGREKIGGGRRALNFMGLGVEQPIIVE